VGPGLIRTESENKKVEIQKKKKKKTSRGRFISTTTREAENDYYIAKGLGAKYPDRGMGCVYLRGRA
jgi:hypothetical protein